MARILARSGESIAPLANWQWLATPAGAIDSPATLPGEGWHEAAAPGTVAGTLRSQGRLDEAGAVSIADQDHWSFITHSNGHSSRPASSMRLPQGPRS